MLLLLLLAAMQAAEDGYRMPDSFDEPEKYASRWAPYKLRYTPYMHKQAYTWRVQEQSLALCVGHRSYMTILSRVERSLHTQTCSLR